MGIMLARLLGAERIIDYKSERFEDQVHDVDLVFDLVGGETQERSWKTLKNGGTMISTLTQPSQEKAQAHQIRVENYVTQPDAEELNAIGELIDENKLMPLLHGFLPFSDAWSGHKTLETESVLGKFVLLTLFNE